MSTHNVRRLPSLRPPLAVGMGLVALDVVVVEGEREPVRYFAGGTCGNVLAALSYLGWDTVPISRLGPDSAAERVVADLARWHVSTKYVTQSEDGSTPIIIERLRRSRVGLPKHRFSWRCPSCGAHLPGYKPVLTSVASALVRQLRGVTVFFFDRVSRGVLTVAQACRSAGAFIMFEPSGVTDPGLFREAWRAAHVVKYSHERLREIADIDFDRDERESVWLEIETLGGDGLRYKSRLPKAATSRWVNAPAFVVAEVKDTAGAGDWCTAGLVSRLATKGAKSLTQVSLATLQEAFAYAQALSAWTCGFEAPRGGMYRASRETFARDVARIMKGGRVSLGDGRDEASEGVGRLCPSCDQLGQRHLELGSTKNAR